MIWSGRLARSLSARSSLSVGYLRPSDDHEIARAARGKPFVGKTIPLCGYPGRKDGFPRYLISTGHSSAHDHEARSSCGSKYGGWGANRS